MTRELRALKAEISACRLCDGRFAATRTRHAPRPVFWADTAPRILISGQAPGMRVHQSGIPFDDKSGDRLRAWMGLTRDQFYDRRRIAIVPMAFCFPGYSATGSDLPPPPLCAETWRARVMGALGPVPLTLVIGGYAQRYHFQTRAPVTETVRNWRECLPVGLPLPHPSWRNTAWIRKNPWFESELLPELRRRVGEVLND